MTEDEEFLAEALAALPHVSERRRRLMLQVLQVWRRAREIQRLPETVSDDQVRPETQQMLEQLHLLVDEIQKDLDKD